MGAIIEKTKAGAIFFRAKGKELNIRHVHTDN